MEKITNEGFSNLNTIIKDGLYGIKKTFTERTKNYATGKTAAFCPRLAYLNSKVESEVTLTALPLITASMGKVYENHMLESLQNNDTLWGYDLCLNNETFPIKNMSFFGIIDAVVGTNKDNLYVVDFKTKTSVDEETKADAQDIAQLSAYCALTGLPGSLIYLSRKVNEGYNVIGHKIIPLEIDYKHILHMMFFSSYVIKNNLMPPKPKNLKKSIECKYCKFVPICYNDEPVNFEFTHVTKDAYDITEQYAISYLENITSQREKFINLMLENKLRGKYFKSLEERN